VDIFGTSDANTCVSLFYEKLERCIELFVPVFRSTARPMTHPWYTRELLSLENRKAWAFMYSSRTGNRELYERLRAKHRHLYNECYTSSINGIQNGIKRDPKRFFDFANYKRKISDLFESVYNVDTCDSETEDVSDPSDGCSFSSIQLRMSDLEAAISTLDATNDCVPPFFVKFCADGLESPLFLPALFHPNVRIPSSFLVS
jgi:hypothetical protein